MDKCSAYLFTHFVGLENKLTDEQVYMSVSRDGISWDILNGGECILQSHIGERGVRDPFCIRRRGGGYYIIATNLSIYNRIQALKNKNEVWKNSRNRFPDNPTPGNGEIIVWESDDLIHWSEARSIAVAPEGAGSAWAPKAIYDKSKEMYMVVWASTIPDDDYAFLRLYRAYTSDFASFTEPELWLDRSDKGYNALDAVIAEDNGSFYRIYKSDKIRIETAESLGGEWESVNGNIAKLAVKHEGAAIYKNNISGEWELLLDCLNKEVFGYERFVTDDMGGGVFRREHMNVPEGIIYRHGSVMPITEREYKALRKWDEKNKRRI